MSLGLEQLPRETAKAYAAFRVYLGMGPTRSIRRVAEQLGRKPRGLEAWSQKYHWPERALAYSHHLAELERQTIEACVVDKAVIWHAMEEPQRRKEWEQGERCIKAAERMLERLQADPKRVGSYHEAARLMELGLKLCRMAVGMPTEVRATNTQVTGKLDVNWQVALEKIYGPAPAGQVVEVVEVQAETKQIGDTANEKQTG